MTISPFHEVNTSIGMHGYENKKLQKIFPYFLPYSMKSLKKSVERRDTNSTPKPMSLMKEIQIIKQFAWYLGMITVKTVFRCQFHLMNDMHKRKHNVGEDLRVTLLSSVETGEGSNKCNKVQHSKRQD